MATTISVNKKTIREFLENAQKEHFLIPEYQRPYAWEEDQIITLFEDLKNFTEKKIADKNSDAYFLGSIVQFINDAGEQEIIDGQQRITSLLLLLRVIYTKMEKGGEVKTEEEENFMREIEPLLWQKDEFKGKVDKEQILINSKVILDEQNQTFHNILKTGEVAPDAKDRYSKNYLKFQELYDEFCKNNPQKIYNFILNLLRYTIILPIEADTQDTALTIFSTLNDRGMPLNDADIFKAQIYESLDKAQKAIFIEQWKELENRAKRAGEDVRSLFYIYMFYLRAQKGDKDTTTPKLRGYLGADKFKAIKSPDLLSNLNEILSIIKFSKDFESFDGAAWSKNYKIAQTLDLLQLTNNEWWKYPSVIYYLSHKSEPDFEQKYLRFLRRLFVEIWQRLSLENTVNSLKTPILKLNSEVIKNSEPIFEFKEISIGERDLLNAKIKEPRLNLRFAILKFLAYESCEQGGAISNLKLEVEHIFPQKWQNYLEQSKDWTDEKLTILKDNIGNLTLLEKKLNIAASNDYFGKKKIEYEKSNIKMTNKLGQRADWKPDDIIVRNSEICKFVEEKFTQWAKA